MTVAELVDELGNYPKEAEIRLDDSHGTWSDRFVGTLYPFREDSEDFVIIEVK